MRRSHILWVASTLAAAILAVPGFLAGLFRDELKAIITKQMTTLSLLESVAISVAFVELVIIVAVLYSNARKNEEIDNLSKRNLHLIEKAQTDTKSGLSSYEFFSRALEDEYIPSVKKGEIFSVLMIDLVDFKVINDRLGHDAGDEVISRVGGFLKAFVRGKRDLAARFGEAADEFFFVIHGDTAALSGFTNRLRRELKQESIESFELLKSNSTVLQFWSSGTEVKSTDSWESVKKRLMRGLIKAKQASPDSIVIVPSE